MNLPKQFLENMKDLLQDDYDSFLESYNHPSFNGLRVNTLKISVEEFLKINPFHLTPVPWCENGFYYEQEDNPSQHPFYYAGLYYLQEPSAMAPASFLPIEENDLVLDLCSAPGGKATQIASKLNNTGLLVSNDISASRQNATLRNLERFGVRNCCVISDDPDRLKDRLPETFDKILVDAPCSGEGMFRKDSSLIRSWEERGNDYYVPIQKEILNAADRMLKNGGMIMYSTCTFSTHEDENIISSFLNEHPDYELLPVSHPLFSNGYGLENCARLFPHKLNGEGHFLALLRKNGSAFKENKQSCCLSYEKPVDDFMNKIKWSVNNRHIETIKDKVLLVNNDMPDFKSIRALRSGLLLGTVKKDSFEPSQQLAMALKGDEFDQVINLDINDERVNRYLKGETIEYDCPYDGWVLICIDRYPLGFGKIKNKRIKNKIDSGWRKL
ncbi:MAG: RsmF rRNA methyltransferase first C-terminal domain-containing protein [Erysipelotrichaceae bacterium]|nr:RsmF rRNA methyltransferase first C-terminal domain-containing protein [Erysipelotrichaceae bacterium]